MGTNSTPDNPWGEFVNADNYFGDYWFVERYKQRYWALAGVLLVVLPPAGAFMLGYMAVGSIFHEDDEIPAEIQAD